MELKTGYKQTKVGVIPSDWEVKTLSSVSTDVIDNRGKTPPHIDNGEKELIETNSISFCIKYPEYSKVSKFVDKKTFEIWFRGHPKQNDILISTVGEYSGASAIMELSRGTIAQNLIAIRIDQKHFDSNYIFYWTRSGFYQNQINQVMMNQAQPSLRVPWLLGFNIPLPPTLTEQTAIATALSDTDQYITHLEKLIAKKRDIKQGAMQELLKPKEGWGVNTYGEIFDFLTTATYSRADLSDTGEIGYVHYGDIHTKWSSFLDFEKYKLPTIVKNQLKNYPLLREGDIIMADASEDYSGVGESIEVINLGENKSIAGLHTFLLRDKKGVFVNGFKGYIHKGKIVKSQIEKLASGLKVYGISKYNLKSVQIPIPPIEEQTRIFTILSDMDSEIATLETKLSKAQSIKQGMMQQLLTGKIRLK